MDTQMEEVISILQNPEKMEFHLNNPPKNVHGKNILQTTFKFCDPRECFSSFRMVCKSWQNAVETIRLDAYPKPIETLLQELGDQERHGNFPTFYPNYLKIFRQVVLHFPDNFDMTKWNSIASLLSGNLKNLNFFYIGGNSLPQNITYFLFKLFENSQSTLETLAFNTRDNFYFPTIPLPNLTKIQFRMSRARNCRTRNNQIDGFDYFIKSFVDSDTMCENLEILELKRPNDKILQYIIKNYPNHFVYSPFISLLEHIPLNISFFSLFYLKNLEAYRFISQVEYLILHVEDFRTPCERGWDNYREITSFSPNLKGIAFYHDKRIYSPEEILTLESLSLTTQNIWQQRIAYFNSQNIEIISRDKFERIKSDLAKSKPSWHFEFML